MADSLIERAKVVVDTSFVDESFAVSGWQGARRPRLSAGLAAAAAAAAAAGSKPSSPSPSSCLLSCAQETFVPELEAELAALRTRAEQAEASASQLEETLKVC